MQIIIILTNDQYSRKYFLWKYLIIGHFAKEEGKYIAKKIECAFIMLKVLGQVFDIVTLTLVLGLILCR